MIFMIIVQLRRQLEHLCTRTHSGGVKLSVLHTTAWQFPALVIAGQLWKGGQADPFSGIHLLRNNSSFSMCTPILCHVYIFLQWMFVKTFNLQVEQFVLEGQQQPGEHSLVQQSELNSVRSGQSSRLNVLLTIMTTGCTSCKDSPLF